VNCPLFLWRGMVISLWLIAEILDHTTDVVAGIYTKNTSDITSDIVERFDHGWQCSFHR